MFAQQIDESASATAADIECRSSVLGETDGFFELGEAVGLQEWLLPVIRDLVVLAAERFRIHA
jgi:hypothetical protein